MTDLTELSLAAARDALVKKEVSAVDLAKAQIAAVERARALNCFIVETPEKRVAQWRPRPTSGSRRGEARPLEGIPLGIKDLYCTKGVHTTACEPHPRRLHADL